MSNDITGNNNNSGSGNGIADEDIDISGDTSTVAASDSVSKDEPSDKSEIIISQADIQTYFFVTTGYCSGLIPCRSFADKDSGTKDANPITCWIASDDNVVSHAMEFAALAHQNRMGCFIIPGTVEKAGQAGSKDVLQMQTLLIDIDTGNTQEKLALLTEHIGTPTMVVESGGITKEGYKKLHIYWQLSKAVEGEQLLKLMELRAIIAKAAEGDEHFNSAHQPIRVAGSVYYKGGARKLVTIRVYNLVEYELKELEAGAARLVEAKGLPILADDSKGTSGFNNQPPKVSVNEVLTKKIYAGGKGEHTRYKYFSIAAGHWVRCWHEGLMDWEPVLKKAIGYNLSSMIPPWPESKVKRSIEAIRKLHIRKYGQPKKQHAQGKNVISPVRLSDWKGKHPPEREWIIEDWLPRGCVTALYGDGAVGKTLLIQQLMTCIVTGRSIMDKQVKPGRVYAIMCEDDYDELLRRQFAINEYYGIDMGELENAYILSRVGENNLLMTFDYGSTGKPTEFFDELHDNIIRHNPDLVVFDTAADLFGGNENSRPDVRQFIQNICGKVAKTAKAAVLFCAHPSESGMSKGTGTGGSTAWSNTVRSRWYFKRLDGKDADKDHRILIRTKSNYSVTGEEAHLIMQKGVFIPADPNKAQDKDKSGNGTGSIHYSFNRSMNEMKPGIDAGDNYILSALIKEAARGHVYSAGSFCEAYKGNPGLGGKNSIRERINALMKSGHIGIIRNGADYGLAANTSSFGLLCVEGMELLRNNGVRQKVLPTHYMDHISGNIMAIENHNNQLRGKEVRKMG